MYGEDYSPGLTLHSLPKRGRSKPLARMAMAGVDNKFLENQTIKELAKLMGAQTPEEEAKRLRRIVNIDMRKEQL